MEIHERIRKARRNKKITQEEVARRLGTTQQQINKYETGKQEMTTTRFKCWCEVLNVSADEVLELKIQK